MARPSNTELVKRAERTRAAIAEADPHATAELIRAKRSLLKNFSRDAAWWYRQVKHLAEHATREEEPRVKLAIAMMRTFLPEQRTFPAAPIDESVRPAVQLTIVAPPGMQLTRGTAASRDEAIEVQATKQTQRPRQLAAMALPGVVVGSKPMDGAT